MAAELTGRLIRSREARQGKDNDSARLTVLDPRPIPRPDSSLITAHQFSDAHAIKAHDLDGLSFTYSMRTLCCRHR